MRKPRRERRTVVKNIFAFPCLFREGFFEDVFFFPEREDILFPFRYVAFFLLIHPVRMLHVHRKYLPERNASNSSNGHFWSSRNSNGVMPKSPYILAVYWHL